MKYYIYNTEKYYDEDDLRQAIWKKEHIIFGALTSDLMTKFSVTEEEYTAPVHEVTLEEAQETKHSELKREMEAKREQLTVTYDNDTFNANTEAQSNMMVLLKAFDLGVTEVSIRSSTEKTHTFTQTQCNELSLLMLSAVNSIYSQYWELKDKIYSATTVDDVNSIYWN